MNTIKPSEVPKHIRYKGKVYNQGIWYANLEECRREMRYLRAHGADILVKKYNVEIFPGARILVRYQIYYGGKKK